MMSTSDERLQAVARIAGDAILASYFADAEPDHQFSPEFEQKMERLLQQDWKKPRYTVLQKVASVILAIAIGSGIWLAIDTDARAAVFGWIREQYENIFQYHFEGNTDVPSEQTYELGWLPEGYQFHHRRDNDINSTVMYTNEIGDIITLTYKTGTNEETSDFFVLDATGEKKTVKVGEVIAQLYLTDTPDDSNMIVWANIDTMQLFSITSVENEETLIKMAENVIPVRN